MSSSYTLGTTFQPVKQLSLQLSVAGLGTTPMTIAADYAKSIKGGVSVTGFEYVSALGDTIPTEIKREVSSFTSDLQNGVSTSLNPTSHTFELKIPRTINAALNYHYYKNSFVGVHYVSKTNSINDYDYLGFTTLLWLNKNIQLKGGYYMAMDENNLDAANAVIQFRITPLLQVYAGSNTVSDLATIAANSGNGSLKMASSTTQLNFTVGASLAFFDKRFKKDKEEKEKAKNVKTLSPEDQKKVDDAYKKSDAVKDNK
jgi:hypothetical protein